jgi:hypothetical protein
MVLSAWGTLRRVITRDIVRTIVTRRVPLRAGPHWIVIVLSEQKRALERRAVLLAALPLLQ